MQMTVKADPGQVGPVGLAAAVGRHPRLWGEAVRSLLALAPARWWVRRPFVPRPEPAYLAWRTSTAYGSPEADVDPADLVAFLEWRRTYRRATRR